MPRARVASPARVGRLPATRPQLARLLWLIGELRASGRLRAPDLAAHFEITVRTAYRDIDFLRDQLGAPIEYDHARGSYVLTEPGWSVPIVDLSAGAPLKQADAEASAPEVARGFPSGLFQPGC